MDSTEILEVLSLHLTAGQMNRELLLWKGNIGAAAVETDTEEIVSARLDRVWERQTSRSSQRRLWLMPAKGTNFQRCGVCWGQVWTSTCRTELQRTLKTQLKRIDLEISVCEGLRQWTRRWSNCFKILFESSDKYLSEVSSYGKSLTFRYLKIEIHHSQLDRKRSSAGAFVKMKIPHRASRTRNWKRY